MISIAVTGTQDVQQVLERVADPTLINDILDETAAFLLYKIRQRFLAQTDPDGKPWVPSYASILRKRKGRGGGTLFDTGRLFHSIQLYAEGPNSRLIGTDVPYAKYHQDGIGDMHRPFLGLAEDDVGPITQMVL